MPSTDRLSNIARARVSAVVLDEASGRERQAHACMASVTAKLQKAHSLMGAKDELLAARCQHVLLEGLRCAHERRAVEPRAGPARGRAAAARTTPMVHVHHPS